MMPNYDDDDLCSEKAAWPQLGSDGVSDSSDDAANNGAAMLPYFHAAMLPYFHAAMLPCFHTSMLPCFHASMLRPTSTLPNVHANDAYAAHAAHLLMLIIMEPTCLLS